MTIEEFDAMDNRLRDGYSLRGEIEEVRRFIAEPAMTGNARVMVTEQQLITDHGGLRGSQRPVFVMPMSDLQPMLRQYAETRLELLIKKLDEL